MFKHYLLGVILILIITGCGFEEKEVERPVPAPVYNKGRYLDSNVSGIEYIVRKYDSNADSSDYDRETEFHDITNEDGTFGFIPGRPLEFQLAGMRIRYVEPKHLISGVILIEDNPKAASLLQSFDSDGDASNGIELLPELVDILRDMNLSGQYKDIKESSLVVEDLFNSVKSKIVNDLNETVAAKFQGLRFVNETEAMVHVQETIEKVKTLPSITVNKAIKTLKEIDALEDSEAEIQKKFQSAKEQLNIPLFGDRGEVDINIAKDLMTLAELTNKDYLNNVLTFSSAQSHLSQVIKEMAQPDYDTVSKHIITWKKEASTNVIETAKKAAMDTATSLKYISDSLGKSLARLPFYYRFQYEGIDIGVDNISALRATLLATSAQIVYTSAYSAGEDSYYIPQIYEENGNRYEFTDIGIHKDKIRNDPNFANDLDQTKLTLAKKYLQESVQILKDLNASTIDSKKFDEGLEVESKVDYQEIIDYAIELHRALSQNIGLVTIVLNKDDKKNKEEITIDINRLFQKSTAPRNVDFGSAWAYQKCRDGYIRSTEEESKKRNSVYCYKEGDEFDSYELDIEPKLKPSSEISLLNTLVPQIIVNGEIVNGQDLTNYLAESTGQAGATTTTEVNTSTASPNRAPIANAGEDQSVTFGTSVTLDASQSSDFEGEIVSYQWKEGDTLLGSDINFTTDTFPIGTHIITLTVADANYQTASDEVNITIKDVVANTPPVANAGSDQRVATGTAVTLNASQSSDSDGNIVAYQWKEGETLLSSDTSFTSSAFSEGEHPITLIVTDNNYATSTDRVNITVYQTTNKNISDAYIIKLQTPAIAVCNNGESYQSSLSVGTKGKILFDETLTADCNITVAKGAIMDSNNNGELDANDKELEFDLKAPANVTFITPLSTLLLEKKEKGEDVADFEALIKDFDPVETGNSVVNQSGLDKVQTQKLMVLVEVLKTSMKTVSSTEIMNIDLSPVVTTSISETLDDLSVDDLVQNLPEIIQAETKENATIIKNVVNHLDDIDGTKVNLASYMTNISDGGTNIEYAIKGSLKEGVTLTNSDTISQVVKNGTSTVINTLNTINDSINNHPIAKAGVDRNITSGGSTVVLNASESFDSDGNIVSYEWRDGESILSSDKIFTSNYFTVGTYTITLTVTDNKGATSSDDVIIMVEVPNQAPTANAGADQTVSFGTTVTLSALNSLDNDGTIVSYTWREGNTVLSTEASFDSNGFTVGEHRVTLTVIDNSGSTVQDSVVITVTPLLGNQAPIANAGADQSSTAGTAVTLSASNSSDSDGNIIGYAWHEGATLLSSNEHFSISTLSVGEHTITLTVKDNGYLTTTDDVVVTITGNASNQAPTANAGADQNTTAGTEITLSASNSVDSDGNIVSYQWHEGATLLSSDENFSISTFSIGEHTVRLTVTDNNYETATDDVVVRVSSNSSNQAPVANAGSDQNVTLGDAVTLSASQSSDGDGTIIAYEWSEDGAVFSRGENFTTTGLSVGEHNITLKVTDNGYKTDRDSLIVKVEGSASNQAPTANAGADQSSTAGTAVTLSASNSSDSDGNIIGYAWKEGSVVLSSDENFTISTLSVGEHTITLTVKDNGYLTTTDDVVVTITGNASNQAPTANAGADQSVTEGDTVYLSASGSSDSDGSITSYQWKEGTTTLSNQSSFSTSSLSAGTHTITVTVTDNEGATDSDTVVITVDSTSSGTCLNTAGEGSTTPMRYTIETESTSGTFILKFETYIEPDEIIVEYPTSSGMATWTSGPIGTQGWQTEVFTYSGATTATITVKPSKNNTQWKFELYDSCITGSEELGDEYYLDPVSEGVIITHNGFSYSTITSPVTGKVWLDRNLGASQACTAYNDTACYGDYYQWGRNTDGHEKSDSSTISTQADTITPQHDDFIIGNTDWTTADSGGTERQSSWNPCPSGYRVPTVGELQAENIQNRADAFSKLLLPSAGYRIDSSGSVHHQGFDGRVWSSSPDARYLYFYSDIASLYASYRADGFSVRCLKE